MSSIALSVGQYRLSFRALESISLPGYSGSAWRGVFGHALKRAVCVTHERVCSGCMLYYGCAYSYVFETPPPPDSRFMRQYPSAPHPFVIYPGVQTQRDLHPGDEISIELLVYGRANSHLPYLIFAFQKAGEKGIGHRHGSCRLSKVEQNLDLSDPEWRPIWDEGTRLSPAPAAAAEIPDCPERIRVEFQSPLRLKRDEHLVGQQEFEFHDLFRNLLRRISMLMYFHMQSELKADYAGLNKLSREVAITTRNLHWFDWTRYSSRQDSAMQMGGLTGDIELHGQDLTPFWPYLWYGQWTHAGKGTVMGLGRYRIVNPASLPQRTKQRI